MIGGHAPKAAEEHLYEVAFPERPGALGDFLSTVGDKWNISLFHYRSAASDSGGVMIGFESSEPASLEDRLRSAGFAFDKVNDNSAVKTFLNDRIDN
jgi:threonine dehydratase